MQRRPEEIFSCSIVRAELMHGALKYGVPERRQLIVQNVLAPFSSYAFDDEAAKKYATIRHELERHGQRIGPHDLMIAAICVAHECVLAIANESEFERVPGLKIVNWQKN
jgi:tRNA(fMet)-specific endonuclease VapC